MAFNNLDLTPYLKERPNPIDLAVQRAMAVPQYINSLRAAQQGIEKTGIENKNLPLKLQLQNQLLGKNVERAGIENQFLPEEKRTNIKNLLSTIYGRDLDSQKKVKLLPFVEQEEKASLANLLANTEATKAKSSLPYGGLVTPTNPAGVALWKDYFKQQGRPDLAEAIDEESKKATVKERRLALSAMPASEKNALYGRARALDKNPVSLQKYIEEGGDLDELAQEKGYPSYEAVPADYAFNNTAIGQVQRSEMAQKALQSLNSKISETPAYSGLKTVRDAKMKYDMEVYEHSSDPKKRDEAENRLVNHYTRQILSTEAANAQFKVQGGTPGVTAMEELRQNLIGGHTMFDIGNLPTELQTKVLKKAISAANDAFAAEKKALIKGSLGTESESGEPTSPSATVTKDGKNYVLVNGEWYEQ